MQAPRSLSAVQRDSLESTFVYFKGIAAFLESLENTLQPDETLMETNLRELAGVCEHKLLDAFPELLTHHHAVPTRGAIRPARFSFLKC